MKFENIENWTSFVPKNLQKLQKDFPHRLILKEIDGIKLYCLLKHFISETPSGPYTLLGSDKKPIDNFIWWDFLFLEKESNYQIWIWRTNSCIEVMHSLPTDNDLYDFLKINLKNHAKEVDVSFNTLTKHLTYINHYHSYGNILENLWSKYSSIKIKYPTFHEGHVFIEDELEKKFKDEYTEFTTNIVEKHVTGKSIVLFSSFYIESLIATLFRIGSVVVWSHDKDVHSQIVKMGFKEKLQSISFYTPLFKGKFDLSQKIFKDVFDLMNVRNKYVHSDKTAEINRLGEVYFDEDFPVFPVHDKPFAITNFEETFSQPDDSRVLAAYELAHEFDKLIRSNLTPKYQDSIDILLHSNPIGFNTKLNVFSGLFGNQLFHFGLVFKK